MALVNDPVFAQEPKTAGISFGTGSESTVMDPATAAPTTLVTAGSDGAIVTSVEILAEATSTAEKFVLWVQPGGSGNWYPIKNVLMSAYTMAATTAQERTTLIDKNDPGDQIRLAASDKLGVTHHVDQQSSVFCEYTDM